MAKYTINGFDHIQDFIDNMNEVTINIEGIDYLIGPKFINIENVSLRIWKKKYGKDANPSKIKHKIIKEEVYNKTMYTLNIARCYEYVETLIPKDKRF